MAYIGIKAFPEHVYLVVGNNCAGVNFCRRYIVLDGCFLSQHHFVRGVLTRMIFFLPRFVTLI